jgi:N-acyl-D-amino-acid deacylase
MPVTDTYSLPANPEAVQPRETAPIGFGLFPHYPGSYVTEERVLTLEEAVRKATGLPAQVLGLKERGIIVPGAYADPELFKLDEWR